MKKLKATFSIPVFIYFVRKGWGDQMKGCDAPTSKKKCDTIWTEAPELSISLFMIT